MIQLKKDLLKKSILASALFLSSIANANGVVGKWRTIDDETKKPKSIVEIVEVNGKLEGKITQLFRGPDEDQNPVCNKCTGALKDKPVLGMQIMSGFSRESDTKWVDGKILDPKNGKTYSCFVELQDGGKKLKVRGFIGFAVIGRTQIWERAE